MAQGIEIVGQLIGLKNLKIEGGWRLQIDLFDSRLEDILQVTALVNDKQTVRIKLLPVK